MDTQKLVYVNKYFERAAKQKGFYSTDLMEKIALSGTVHHMPEVPDDVKKVFVVAHDIDPEWHIKIQAAFQKYTDNAVSKTVNFRSDATTKDVENTYLMAYNLGCKGVTIYRDRSRSEQVINLDTTKLQKKDDLCPNCKSKLYFSEGCSTCPSCGYSKCSIA
jgi:ribonucleoside-diphosphate reductase alpha chain